MVTLVWLVLKIIDGVDKVSHMALVTIISPVVKPDGFNPNYLITSICII